jgi:DHA2 family multidrug resistance protein
VNTPAATADPNAGASRPAAAAELPPLAGGALAITGLALALGTFMQVLDSSIANVSIPTIAGDLGVSSDQGTWVITSFAVSNGVSVPLTGWLMQRFGVVRTFVVSVFAFTLASWLCGLSWSLPSLIVFRVLQGAVSGPMIPGSQALLLSVFGPARRGAALGIWSITALVGPIAGPVLGGYISDNFVWPWIFYINVPVGIFAGFICWRFLRMRETPTRKLRIDTVGLGLLMVWVGSLQIMLDKGKDLDWFESTTIVTLAVLTVIGFIAWLIWELTESAPIVDLSLFKGRSFSLGTLTLCLGYAVFFANVVLMPLWLQEQVGYTATWAGLVAAPSGVVAVIFSPLVGRMMGRYDARWFATGSLFFFGVSYLMRARYTADASFIAFVLPQLVLGIGMSLFFVSMLAISLDGIRPEKVPAAAGLSNFLRIVAGGFATSLITTFWDRRETLHQARLSEAITPYAASYVQSLTQLHALGLGDQAAAGLMTRGMISQGYLLSSLDLFYLSGWLVLAMIPLCWLVRRPAGHGQAVAAE